MFIRIKKVKDKEYVYLVDNKWNKRKNSSRQKTKKYLGRNYKLTKTNPTDFFDFMNKDISHYLEETKPKKIILDLIKHELYQHNFINNKESWKQKNLLVDIENIKVIDDKTQKLISLEMNEGFLNNHTLKSILTFKFPEGDQKDMAKALANSLLASGIAINQDIFVSLFTKLSEENKKVQESL